MNTKSIFKVSFLAACCWVMSPAMAQTPDGMTPAVETFCDDHFQGNLKGLCNAFCEAMDCDSSNPSASSVACSKVGNKIQPLLDAYNQDNSTHLVIRASDENGENGLCDEEATVCPDDVLAACSDAQSIANANEQGDNFRQQCELLLFGTTLVTDELYTIKTDLMSCTYRFQLKCDAGGTIFNGPIFLGTATYSSQLSADEVSLCRGQLNQP